MRLVLPTLLLLLALGRPALSEESQKSVGKSSAPVRIDLFSDFQCPACKALYENTIRTVMQQYCDAGKVYLVHHDFPLPIHQYAREAATYAVAASRLGKYEPVGAALFRDQITWTASGKLEPTVASVLTPGDMQKVQSLLKDPKISAEIEGDIAAGKAENLTQTPTMVITHLMRRYPIAGVVQYSILKQFIDSLLVK